MSENLLEKVVTDTTIGGSNTAGQGGLTYAQADRFLDYMWDATVLGSYVRKRRMRAVEEEIDTIAIGSRLMRGATEAVDTGENVQPTFGKLSITTKKLRLDWELSSESLEDNIEGQDLEDHIARLMATAAGNDLEDLAINGDTTSGDPLLKVFDGWRKRAVAGGHVVDAAGSLLNRGVFNQALKAVPRKYMQQRGNLKFFAGSNAIQDWLFSFQQVEAGLVNPLDAAQQALGQSVRTEGAAGFNAGRVFGTPIIEVPLFDEARDGDYDTDSGTSGVQVPSANIDHTDLWLTFPDNLIWGVKRDVEVYREFKPKKDTIEYTVYCRQGVQIENLDAFVVVKNVKIGA